MQIQELEQRIRVLKQRIKGHISANTALTYLSLRLHKQLADLYYSLGLAYESNLDWNSAILAFTASKRLNYNASARRKLEFKHKNPPKTIASMLRQGNQSAEHYYAIASRLSSGYVCVRNYEQAFVYFQRAAQLDHATATYMLGELSEHGLGTIQNLEAACHYYKQAAAMGCAEAYTALGWLKARHPHIDGETNNCHVYFNKAAALLHSEAFAALAFLYLTGRFDTTRPHALAIAYYSHAVAMGDTPSAASLGNVYGHLYLVRLYRPDKFTPTCALRYRQHAIAGVKHANKLLEYCATSHPNNSVSAYHHIQHQIKVAESRSLAPLIPLIDQHPEALMQALLEDYLLTASEKPAMLNYALNRIGTDARLTNVTRQQAHFVVGMYYYENLPRPNQRYRLTKAMADRDIKIAQQHLSQIPPTSGLYQKAAEARLNMTQYSPRGAAGVNATFEAAHARLFTAVGVTHSVAAAVDEFIQHHMQH